MLSYVDAVFNLSDLGGKLRGNLGIWARFLMSGQFGVSFLGRKKAKEDHGRQNESKSMNVINTVRAAEIIRIAMNLDGRMIDKEQEPNEEEIHAV